MEFKWIIITLKLAEMKEKQCFLDDENDTSTAGSIVFQKEYKVGYK